AREGVGGGHDEWCCVVPHRRAQSTQASRALARVRQRVFFGRFRRFRAISFVGRFSISNPRTLFQIFSYRKFSALTLLTVRGSIGKAAGRATPETTDARRTGGGREVT
ncbi:unnamed protein product, partial [Ectocarpus sp. 13 AM-2016]